MKNLLRLALLAAMCAAPAAAQSPVIGNVTDGFNESTYAARPTAPVARQVWVFTDAPSAGDCSGGGGSARALCRWTGAAWEALGGSGAGSGVSSLNSLTGALSIATGTSGSDFSIDATGSTITLNLPTASAVNRGLLSSADYSTFANSVLKTPGVAQTLQPSADVIGLTVKQFNGTNAAGYVFRVLSKADVCYLCVADDGTVTFGGSGAGSTEFVTGSMTASASGRVKIGAHTGNVFSFSENAGSVMAVVGNGKANTYGAGFKQTFTPSSTMAGFNIAPAALPSSPATGDCAVDSGASNLFKCYDGTAWQAIGGGASSAPFSDASALVKNSADATKLAIFSASGISTASTRTFTLPNRDGTLALTAGLTNGSVSCGQSNGDVGNCAATSSSITLTSSTTAALTVNPGNVSSTNNGGALLLAGANNTSASTGSAGSTTVRGGDQTAASTGGSPGALTLRAGNSAGQRKGGNATFEAGLSSNATPAEPGEAAVIQPFINGPGTSTANRVQCPVAAAVFNVDDCPTSATNPVGVGLDTNVTIRVVVLGIVSVQYDGTYSPSAGWYACTSATTAGQVLPQSADCAAGRRIGIVVENGSSVTSGRILISRN